ncbi:MAG: hypothetical protein KJ574_04640, partial [Nanoarchaeota archaeon]|nr:hypothetical protein [Nanoarchaeota archaeon]
MRKSIIILFALVMLVALSLCAAAEETSTGTTANSRDTSTYTVTTSSPRDTTTDTLISTSASATNSLGCVEYCRDSVYYYRGSYNTRTAACEYSYMTRCENGCNREGTACLEPQATTVTSAVPTTTQTVEAYCSPYCRGDIYYYEGTYDARTGICTYAKSRDCDYGCDSRGTECASQVVRNCPDYCSDGIAYYRGTYNPRSRMCEYGYRTRCEFSCDRAGTACSEAPTNYQPVIYSGDYCRETDDGIDFEEAGRVSWKNAFDDSEGTLSDHCVGNEIVEYYCQRDMVRNVAYKDCFDEDKVCKNAVCVEMEVGECIDPDGNDVTQKTWAEGTNVWNEGPLGWGDYCSEEPDGGSTNSGPYVHEAICLETDDNFFEVRYASPQKCKDGCVDGICVGTGEVEEASPLEACLDYDAGIVVKTSSYVHGDSGKMVGDFYDFCSDHDAGIGYVEEGDYVHEYFCEDGFVVGKTIECDEKCYLGSCAISSELEAVATEEETGASRERKMLAQAQEKTQPIVLQSATGVSVERRNNTFLIRDANREVEVEDKTGELISRHVRSEETVERV